ncbi:SWIM zinc finger family protein [Synechococcus sp. PCC 6312]|uniref:SWIM zinc finger family protein n=1 Tax=Synechococcus sp. (strain ATCC 27167 / PCC 6312) TaxID=195253 RepID=UPI00029ED800|nr:SWIM zinc finger family protein [Synechococcus sp. PCC 6312]AFY60077.1 hypothetical protein Syn6312_0869 [Synechococcus sp. PCC 6312]
MTTKTATDLIYTAANAARILGKRFSNLVIEIWANVVYLHGSKISRFVSKTAFKQMFVEFRKAGAKALTVTANLFVPNTYKVRNETKGTAYDVLIIDRHITCGCEDYTAQYDAMGKGVCKHGYAVLNHLGYNCLADYLRA